MAVPHFTTEELKSEEWRDAVGFEGIYSVSCLGRIRRDGRNLGAVIGRILIPLVRQYVSVKLSIDGKGYRRFVHCLVAAAFIGPCPPGKEVNHKDGVKANCRVSNLEYLTHKENVEHAVKNGLTCSGPRHASQTHPELVRRGIDSPAAKLTEDDVREIRRAVGLHRDIAAMFGVSVKYVGCVRRGQYWKHLP